MASGSKNHQTARAGEHYVAAELNRRGAYAVTFAGNMPKIDILASDTDRERTISIQVKTRRTGTWHASTKDGRQAKRKKNEDRFWIFVDIEKVDSPPCYYIVPDWWMRNDIFKKFEEIKARHGGQRAKNPDSTHHGIRIKRVEQWKDRWDILKVF